MGKRIHFICGYKILKEHNLIIELRSGVATLNCMMTFKKKQMDDPNFDPSFNIISDTSELYIDFVITELKKYTDEYKGTEEAKCKKKIAGIVTTPHQIAHGITLRKYLQEEIPIDFEFFPDVQAAIDWLQIPFNEKEVLDIIEEIRKNPQFVCG